MIPFTEEAKAVDDIASHRVALFGRGDWDCIYALADALHERGAKVAVVDLGPRDSLDEESSNGEGNPRFRASDWEALSEAEA